MAAAFFLVLVYPLPAADCRRKHRYARNSPEIKDTLVELLNMQLEDPRLVRIVPSLTRLDTDWSWPRRDIGIQPDRWERYRKLFIKEGLPEGIQFDHGYVFYFVASVGLAIGVPVAALRTQGS